MEIIRDIEGLKRCRGGTCVLTMGALHAGHLSLIHAGVALDRHPVVTTIFVNPAQFAADEDLSGYPRPIENDILSAKNAGTDFLFLPSVELIYPQGVDSTFTPPLPKPATEPGLEDAQRTIHFTGVCRVVHRFFDLLKPEYALFGEKDYQQLLVIREMVRECDLPIEVVGYPIVRETDGLALSSRNAYLNDDERTRALGLAQALKAVVSRGVGDIAEGENLMREVLRDHDVSIDYAVIRNGKTLMPICAESVKRYDCINNKLTLRALVAGRVGSTRLIDNCEIVLRGE